LRTCEQWPPTEQRNTDLC